MTVETSLEYELTPVPLSLFSNHDQKINKANKAGFYKTSSKDLTDLLDLSKQPCFTLVVDGGWLLYMVKWEQGQTPTEGAAPQHSLRAYLQTQDWLLLQSMSLDPKDYGWTVGFHGYEPVPTLEPMAPEELLQFTSCNRNGDCSNAAVSGAAARRMPSSASQLAESVKALPARMLFMMKALMMNN